MQLRKNWKYPCHRVSWEDSTHDATKKELKVLLYTAMCPHSDHRWMQLRKNWKIFSPMLSSLGFIVSLAMQLRKNWKKILAEDVNAFLHLSMDATKKELKAAPCKHCQVTDPLPGMQLRKNWKIYHNQVDLVCRRIDATKKELKAKIQWKSSNPQRPRCN